MQLNLFNNLNHIVSASIRANYSLVEINGRIASQLLENNASLMASTLSSCTRILSENTAPTAQLSIAGKLANKSLASGLESGKNAADILNSSRGEFEKWAIESAAELGKITRRLAPMPRD